MSDFPTYSAIVDALHARFETVPDLAQRDADDAVINILKYEPRVVHTTPLLYTLLDSFTREVKGQLVIMRYRILHRIVFQWQDNEESEAALMPFVHSVPYAVEQSMQLGGTLSLGLARITDATSGFVLISQTKYRCLDLFSQVEAKAAFGSGM